MAIPRLPPAAHMDGWRCLHLSAQPKCLGRGSDLTPPLPATWGLVPISRGRVARRVGAVKSPLFPSLRHAYTLCAIRARHTGPYLSCLLGERQMSHPPAARRAASHLPFVSFSSRPRTRRKIHAVEVAKIGRGFGNIDLISNLLQRLVVQFPDPPSLRYKRLGYWPGEPEPHAPIALA